MTTEISLETIVRHKMVRAALTSGLCNHDIVWISAKHNPPLRFEFKNLAGCDQPPKQPPHLATRQPVNPAVFGTLQYLQILIEQWDAENKPELPQTGQL